MRWGARQQAGAGRGPGPTSIFGPETAIRALQPWRWRTDRFALVLEAGLSGLGGGQIEDTLGLPRLSKKMYAMMFRSAHGTNLDRIYMDFMLIILGALLATGGGCVGHHFSAKLSRDAEKRRVLREQLVQVAGLTVSVNDWLEKLKEDINAVPPRHTEADPTTLIHMFVTLYFPEVKDVAEQFSQAVDAYAQDIRQERLEQLQPDVAKSGRLKTEDELRAWADQYYAPVIKARLKMLDALRSIALKIDN